MKAVLRALNEAQGYLQLGMPEEAVIALDALDSEERQRIEVLMLRTVCLRVGGRWPEMRDTARVLVGRYPLEPEFWISLADATRHAESIQEALALLLVSERFFPNHAHVAFQIGCYYCRLGKLAEARQYLEKAIGLDRSWETVSRQDHDYDALWQAPLAS
jgi:tetratricopeptide (TPR) repeat protein